METLDICNAPIVRVRFETLFFKTIQNTDNQVLALLKIFQVYMVIRCIVSVIAIGGSNTVTYGISLIYICLGLYCNLDVVYYRPKWNKSAKEDQQYVQPV